MANSIRVRAEVLAQLGEEAQRSLGVECCGLLGGGGGVISAVFPARNALASPNAFEIAPEELFRLFREIRAAGLEHLGIYHSHPADNVPSVRDIQLAYYPEAAYFIVSLLSGERKSIRAFAIRSGTVSELTIERIEGPETGKTTS